MFQAVCNELEYSNETTYSQGSQEVFLKQAGTF